MYTISVCTYSILCSIPSRPTDDVFSVIFCLSHKNFILPFLFANLRTLDSRWVSCIHIRTVPYATLHRGGNLLRLTKLPLGKEFQWVGPNMDQNNVFSPVGYRFLGVRFSGRSIT